MTVQTRTISEIRSQFKRDNKQKKLTMEGKRKSIEAVAEYIKVRVKDKTPEQARSIMLAAKLAIKSIQENLNHRGSIYFENLEYYGKDVDMEMYKELTTDIRLKSELEIICAHGNYFLFYNNPLGNRKLSFWKTNYTFSANLLREILDVNLKNLPMAYNDKSSIFGKPNYIQPPRIEIEDDLAFDNKEDYSYNNTNNTSAVGKYILVSTSSSGAGGVDDIEEPQGKSSLLVTSYDDDDVDSEDFASLSPNEAGGVGDIEKSSKKPSPLVTSDDDDDVDSEDFASLSPNEAGGVGDIEKSPKKPSPLITSYDDDDVDSEDLPFTSSSRDSVVEVFEDMRGIPSHLVTLKLLIPNVGQFLSGYDKEKIAVAWMSYCCDIYDNPTRYAQEIFHLTVTEAERDNPISPSLTAKKNVAHCIAALVSKKRGFVESTFTRTLTRGFAKALSLGYIAQKKELAFDKSGRFNTEEFKAFLRGYGSIEFHILADQIYPKYFTGISYDNYTGKVTMGEGISDYETTFLLTTLEPASLEAEQYYIESWTSLKNIMDNQFRYDRGSGGMLTSEVNNSSFETSKYTLGHQMLLNVTPQMITDAFEEADKIELSKVFIQLEIQFDYSVSCYAKLEDGHTYIFFDCNINNSFARNSPDVVNGSYKSVKINNIMVIKKPDKSLEIKHMVITEEFDFERDEGHQAIRGEDQAISQKERGIYVEREGTTYKVTKKKLTINEKDGFRGAVLNTAKKSFINNLSKEQLEEFEDARLNSLFNLGVNYKLMQEKKIKNSDLTSEMKNEYYQNNPELLPLLDKNTKPDDRKRIKIQHILDHKQIAQGITGDIEQDCEVTLDGTGKYVESRETLEAEGFKAHAFTCDKRYTEFTDKEQQNNVALESLKMHVTDEYRRLQSTQDQLLETLNANFNQMEKTEKEQFIKNFCDQPKVVKVKLLEKLLASSLHNIPQDNSPDTLQEILNFYEEMSEKEEKKILRKAFSKNYPVKDPILHLALYIVELKLSPQPDIKLIFMKEYAGDELESYLAKNKNKLNFEQRKALAKGLVDALGEKQHTDKFHVFYEEIINDKREKIGTPIFDIKTKNMLKKDNKVIIIDSTEFEHTFLFSTENKVEENIEGKLVTTEGSNAEFIEKIKYGIKASGNKMEKDAKTEDEEDRKRDALNYLNILHSHGITFEKIYKLQQNFEIIKSIVDIVYPNMMDMNNYVDTRSWVVKYFSGTEKSRLKGIKLANSRQYSLESNQLAKVNEKIAKLLINDKLKTKDIKNFIKELPKPKIIAK